jgi:DNA-binding CsgD family transcriptional regulator
MSDDSGLAVSGPPMSDNLGAMRDIVDATPADRAPLTEIIGDQIFELAQSESENIGQLIVSAAQSLVTCDGGFLSVYRRGASGRHIIYSARVPINLARQIINTENAEGSRKDSFPRGPASSIALSQVHLSEDKHDAHGEPRPNRSYICQVVLRRTRDQIWLLNLVRFNAAQQFGTAEVRILEQLGPFFESLLRRMDHVAQSATLYTAGWAILNALCLGVALIEGDGRVRAANHKARSILGDADGIELRNERIAAVNASDNERLKNALRDLANSHDIPTRALIAERPGSGVGLQLILIRLGFVAGRAGETPQFALFIADPAIVNGADCLRDLYGLTRVESEIANLICQGFNPNEVADKLRMSIHTVRGYLKPMFRKMGARRQADILRLLAAGSGLVQAGAKPIESCGRKQADGGAIGSVSDFPPSTKKVAALAARRNGTHRRIHTRT